MCKSSLMALNLYCTLKTSTLVTERCLMVEKQLLYVLAVILSGFEVWDSCDMLMPLYWKFVTVVIDVWEIRALCLWGRDMIMLWYRAINTNTGG